jgi:uridine kinase
MADDNKVRLEYKPPWFTLQVIGIAGASASGKTSVAKALVKKLNVRQRQNFS